MTFLACRIPGWQMEFHGRITSSVHDTLHFKFHGCHLTLIFMCHNTHDIMVCFALNSWLSFDISCATIMHDIRTNIAIISHNKLCFGL